MTDDFTLGEVMRRLTVISAQLEHLDRKFDDGMTATRHRMNNLDQRIVTNSERIASSKERFEDFEKETLRRFATVHARVDKTDSNVNRLVWAALGAMALVIAEGVVLAIQIAT